ncbi:PP2C family protein-serine/threonine phosphatase [Streptomyces sp. ST2-7A]|uniref:PP2C family protein-serine/threonine phosphatase n=1 Tax=Streptomyces sp. ST2-7A TaxID=2907214 RepID=UPI001F279161|nr:PP2C family protein-serine/threonine phosphatase [Streptomyces sp. ST2-7A]MCE7080742.1 serine/threonine-protein phosphatase [Streptomyces sp. ST2-7A]
MTSETGRHRAPDRLRRAVRRLALDHRLPVETRARLVLSVTASARGEFAARRCVRLSSSVEREADDRPGLLVVGCRPAGTGRRLNTEDLPLPAEEGSDGALTWRIPLPRTPDGTADADSSDGEAVEEELLAVLGRMDTLAAARRDLEYELAETNRGVLALYVQLEERDERLRTAHGQILRELEDALRPPPLELPGLELAVHYEPAGTDAPTGGDLYDWFALPDGSVHITVVDALGHGVTSTRSALTVTHAVRTLALEGHPLESIVARTDEVLLPLDRNLMATVLLARIHLRAGVLELANGSHPPALLVRGDGTAEYLEVPGRGIGFPLPGSERLLRVPVAPGDLVMLYTDGLTESRRDPREGEIRLMESVRKHARRPLEELPGAVAEDMHTVVLHPDDTLALAVRIPPAEPVGPAAAAEGTIGREAAAIALRGTSGAHR